MDKTLKQLLGNKTTTFVALLLAMFEEKMHGSRTNAEEYFSDACRIAKHKHIHLKWDGKCTSVCQPDKWTILANGREYHLQIDSVRYDGPNARCVDCGRS